MSKKGGMKIIHTQYREMLRHINPNDWANEFHPQALNFANSSADFEPKNLMKLFKHVLEKKGYF